MKHLSFLLAFVLLFATALPRPARADDADTGVAIASGLAIAVVAVYALVGLQSDVERYSDATPTGRPADIETAIARASAAAERTPVTAVPVTRSAEWSGTNTEVAGAALAFRTTF